MVFYVQNIIIMIMTVIRVHKCLFFNIYTGARKAGINSVDAPKFRRDPDEPDYYGQVSKLVESFF